MRLFFVNKKYYKMLKNIGISSDFWVERTINNKKSD